MKEKEKIHNAGQKEGNPSDTQARTTDFRLSIFIILGTPPR
ncbi:MAG: hypothetical protein ACTSRG_24370 [Candidatus Helarchaeota archaeon]